MNRKTYLVSPVCVASLLLVGTIPGIAKERKPNSKPSTSNANPTASLAPTKTATKVSRKKDEQPKEISQVSAPPRKIIADIKDKPAPKAIAMASPKVKDLRSYRPDLYTRARK